MRRILQSFASDTNGNFGVISAILSVPVIATAGLAIDFNLAIVEKTKLQAWADAAVLAAAATTSTSETEMRKVVEAHFKGGKSASLAESVSIEKVDYGSDGTIAVNISARMPLTLGKVLFEDGLPVTVSAIAQQGFSTPVDVSLVLDNTGSMSGRKLDDLKKASLSLVSTLEKANKGQVRLALVPFSNYVNVGLGRRRENWISVPKDYSETARVCTKSRPVLSKSGCKTVSKTGYNDGVPYTYNAEQCTTYTYGPEQTTCKDQVNTFRWNGCVGSRQSPLDQVDELKGIKYEGLLNEKCGAEILDLSSNMATVRKAINGMKAQNNTYIPAGILWGWTLLSEREPFTEAASLSASNVDRYMIVMTDGANTLKPVAPKHNADNSGATALKLTAKICENAKLDGITIFTVGVGDLGKETQDALAACASDAKYAFFADDTASLNGIFDKFAAAMMSPRLVR